jgi:hypothetical protein
MGDEPERVVTGSVRFETIELVVGSAGQAPPPHITAIDRRTRRLDANERPHIAVGIGNVPDDDLRVVVGRDGRRGAGARMIVARPDG